MKRVILTSCIVAILLAACTSTEEPVALQSNVTEICPPQEIEQAIAIAEKMIADLDGPQTKSDSRKIRSIQIVNKPLGTRSNIDEDFYIINYEENKGFALVSDAESPYPVYGFSNAGNLTAEDIQNNPAMQDYILNLTYGLSTDSITIGGWGPGYPGNPGRPITDKSHGKVTVSPILPDAVAKWHQGYPLNRYCEQIQLPNGLWETAPTGCTPLACAMILSHYKWPTKYKEFTFDWDNIRENPYNPGLAMLIYYLNQEDNLDTTIVYDFSDPTNPIILTGTLFSLVPRTFYHFGFRSPTIKHGLSIEALNEGNPMIVAGWISDNSLGGHSWVIDGIYEFHHGTDLLSPGIKPYDESFYHTVWGWAGTGNGYYRYGTSNDDTPFYSDSNDIAGSVSTYSNFQSIGTLTKR